MTARPSTLSPWPAITMAWRSLLLLAAALATALPATMEGRGEAAPDTLPKPSRTIRFRASEGTWISLDVSPDGKTIVFDLLGDLYVLPITGGRAQPLTTGVAWDTQPRFSPDGRRVAFVSDRSGTANVWIVGRSGGQARQVSQLRHRVTASRDISSPAWAPDGRNIIVSQRVGAAVRVRLSAEAPAHPSRWLLAAYQVESGRMRWVSDTAASRARRALGPAFAGDGKTIYAAVEPYNSSPSRGTAWHIERIDFSTGVTSPEMAPSLGRIGIRPAVSPDGRLLAYLSVSGAQFGIRLRDLRTYRERWLAHERVDAPASWAEGGGSDGRDLAPGYAFTPDSKALVAAFAGKIHRVELATGTLRVIPFAVDVKRELAPLAIRQFSLPDTAVRTRSILHPALSPDGKTVAFSALNRIWLMDLPTDGLTPASPRRLTSDTLSEFYPSWSPDGTWIAYSSWRDGEGGAVRRAPARAASDNSHARSERLTTDNAVYFNTAVSPAGERVVAVRGPLPVERFLTHSLADHARPLTTVSVLAGGGATTVIAPAAHPELDRWSSLSMAQSRVPVEQLYFTADPRRVHLGLASFGLDGAAPRTDLAIADSVTDVKLLNDITGVMSPDGRRAIVTHNWTLSEVLLPEQQAAPDTLNLEEAQGRRFGHPFGAAARWGSALSPWISWSRDGRRVLFVQGGTLFVGNVPSDGWTEFRRVDVPLPIRSDAPHGTMILRGARLITMRGDEVIARGDIVIHNNRIAAMGPSGSVLLPSAGKVFEMEGKTILPGYVDIHDHLTWHAYGVHPEQCWSCLVRLAHGVTTLRDPYAAHTHYNDIFAYRERERTGDLLAPRIFSTGIVHLQSDRAIRTLADARDIVRPAADYFGAETFKEYSTEPWPARRLVAAAATEAGLNATIHGDHLRAVVDGFSGVEHAMSLRLYDDVLTLVAKSGATFTLTYGTVLGADGYVLSTGREPWNSPRMRRFVPPSARSSATKLWLRAEVAVFGHPEWDHLYPLLQAAAGIAARGGRVGIGSHGNIPGLGFHHEMLFHALGGMPNHDILRAATIVGATAIGHAGDFGSLEPGKLADLQILDRNPLADIHHTTSIRYVMKNGRLYEADSLTQIWPEHKPLNPMYLFDSTSADDLPGGTPALGPALQPPNRSAKTVLVHQTRD